MDNSDGLIWAANEGDLAVVKRELLSTKHSHLRVNGVDKALGGKHL